RKILAQLIKERYDIYAMADITVETKDESLKKTLDKVVNAIKEYQKRQKNG
ncbi:MAG TPA: shikimate kinase, partial [Candidatus Enterousia avicola]|nr:shikimate kinase [Candidatus Enterousia avicola]